MNKTTGGPAFPIPYAHVEMMAAAITESRAPEKTKEKALEDLGEAATGMTLRDYFAAKAIQGLLLDDNGDFSDPNWLAQHAYRFADAMLKARES